jgi:hypothetical protein
MLAPWLCVFGTDGLIERCTVPASFAASIPAVLALESAPGLEAFEGATCLVFLLLTL